MYFSSYSKTASRTFLTFCQRIEITHDKLLLKIGFGQKTRTYFYCLFIVWFVSFWFACTYNDQRNKEIWYTNLLYTAHKTMLIVHISLNPVCMYYVSIRNYFIRNISKTLLCICRYWQSVTFFIIFTEALYKLH